jgi:putative ABC transport system permease protein
MGAGRLRLVRQLLTETLLIAIAGGLAGVGLAYGVIRLFQQRTIISDIGVRVDFNADRRVIAVAVAVSAASALVAGLIPAFRSARVGDLSGTLRNGSEVGMRHRLWGRHTLVTGQVALALALVTVGVFLYQTFGAELRRGPGFRPITSCCHLDATLARYDGPRATGSTNSSKTACGRCPASRRWRCRRSCRSIRTIAIVSRWCPKATSSRRASMRYGCSRAASTRATSTPCASDSSRAWASVDGHDEAPPSVIVNEFMARSTGPGSRPSEACAVPRRHVARGRGYRRRHEIRHDHRIAPGLRLPRRAQDPAIRTTLLVGASGDSASVAAPVRAAVQSLDRDVPITGVWTIEEFYDGNAATLTRYLTGVVGGMGLVGLGLAMVGLYGLGRLRREPPHARDRDPDGHRRPARLRAPPGDAAGHPARRGSVWCSVSH